MKLKIIISSVKKFIWKFKSFAHLIVSLAMPFLWMWIIFKVKEKKIPIFIISILLLQCLAVIISLRKSNRYLAILGIISTGLMIFCFFFFMGIKFWNTILFISILLFYFFFFIDTADSFLHSFDKKKKWKI